MYLCALRIQMSHFTEYQPQWCFSFIELCSFAHAHWYTLNLFVADFKCFKANRCAIIQFLRHDQIWPKKSSVRTYPKLSQLLSIIIVWFYFVFWFVLVEYSGLVVLFATSTLHCNAQAHLLYSSLLNIFIFAYQ